MIAPADAELLEFERIRFRHAGRKVDAILRRFGHSETRYHQRLNALIDRPEALAYDPQLVNRLRRVRDQRASQRRGVTA